jgi:hypothetical protein
MVLCAASVCGTMQSTLIRDLGVHIDGPAYLILPLLF